MRLRFAFVLLLASIPGVPAIAQPPSATVTMLADRTELSVGDLFRLEVRADVTGESNARMQLPELDAFDVIGQQVSNPVQLRFGFGSQTQLVQSTTVHRYTLRARQPGTFRLAPAVVMIGRRRFTSDALVIRVGPSAIAQSDPTTDPLASGAIPPSSGIDSNTFDPSGFVRTVVDNARPFVGQQVTVTIYLYSSTPVSGGLSITQEPTTEGFWVHDLLPPTRSLDPGAQKVRGVDFNVYLLRRFAAFPLHAGSLTIGATGAAVSPSMWDVLGGGGAPLSRMGSAVNLEVQPLPAQGRPAGEVHVGHLELAASLDRSQVVTGDAVQLTVTARGTGAIQQVDVPTPAVEGLRILQPEVDDQISSPGDVVGGTRTYRWLIVPEREGTYTLGPFEMPLFDAQTHAYSLASAPALRIVAAGTAIATGTGDRERPARRRSDTLHLGTIRTRSELARTRTTLVEQPWLAWAFGLGPLALLGALFVRAARRRNADAARKPGHAQREAKRRLASASRHADANEPREFYVAIAQALKEVLEAKLQRPVGSLTHPELRRVLVERGMEADLAETVVDELEGSDFARFSAVGVTQDEMKHCLERTRTLFVRIERFAPRPEEPA